jgi:hypothetical protein
MGDRCKKGIADRISLQEGLEVQTAAQRWISGLIVSVAAGGLAACGGGGGVQGTYGDAASGTKVVLQDGGKATVTLLNMPQPCTYTVANANQVKLDCGADAGGPVVMSVQDNGQTLAMPPGSFLPNLKKTN